MPSMTMSRKATAQQFANSITLTSPASIKETTASAEQHQSYLRRESSSCHLPCATTLRGLAPGCVVVQMPQRAALWASATGDLLSIVETRALCSRTHIPVHSKRTLCFRLVQRRICCAMILAHDRATASDGGVPLRGTLIAALL